MPVAAGTCTRTTCGWAAGNGATGSPPRYGATHPRHSSPHSTASLDQSLQKAGLCPRKAACPEGRSHQSPESRQPGAARCPLPSPAFTASLSACSPRPPWPRCLPGPFDPQFPGKSGLRWRCAPAARRAYPRIPCIIRSSPGARTARKAARRCLCGRLRLLRGVFSFKPPCEDEPALKRAPVPAGSCASAASLLPGDAAAAEPDGTRGTELCDRLRLF